MKSPMELRAELRARVNAAWQTKNRKWGPRMREDGAREWFEHCSYYGQWERVPAKFKAEVARMLLAQRRVA